MEANTELITYKYKNKEINTPTSEGYLTNFQRTKDWIEWLQKEFEISEDNWKEEQFKIQFKSKNQPEYMKLFYTNEEAKKMSWGKDDDGEFEGIISWPPIYLHPLMEDWLPITHECGWKTNLDVRRAKEWLKERQKKGEDDSVYIFYCEKCKAPFERLGKKCIYRVCEEHMGETRQFWIDAWKKSGVNIKEVWMKRKNVNIVAAKMKNE